MTHDPHDYRRLIRLAKGDSRIFDAYQAYLDYERPLYRKYRRAAMFPWLTPEADPPRPWPPQMFDDIDELN